MNLGDIFIIMILVVGGIMFVAPITIFIYSLMKKRKKLLLGACVAIFIEALFILFWASHQTYYKYNDWWIVGKTEEEIVERYGEFDEIWGKSKAYFIYVDNGWIMPDHQHHFYHIEFVLQELQPRYMRIWRLVGDGGKDLFFVWCKFTTWK